MGTAAQCFKEGPKEKEILVIIKVNSPESTIGGASLIGGKNVGKGGLMV